MSTYIDVPLNALASWLESKKFQAEQVGSEIVYRRPASNGRPLSVLVYTSVSKGETVARGVGEDAIRVVLLGKAPNGKEWCLHKCKRIHRTGSVQKVLDRVMDRIMEAADAAAGYGLACPDCGCATYSDSGRCSWRTCREQKQGA